MTIDVEALEEAVRWAVADPQRCKVLRVLMRHADFRVSWRYRDENLMRCCRRMRRKGVLKQVQEGGGETWFELRSHMRPLVTAALATRQTEARPDAR